MARMDCDIGEAIGYINDAIEILEEKHYEWSDALFCPKPEYDLMAIKTQRDKLKTALSMLDAVVGQLEDI